MLGERDLLRWHAQGVLSRCHQLHSSPIFHVFAPVHFSQAFFSVLERRAFDIRKARFSRDLIERGPRRATWGPGVLGEGPRCLGVLRAGSGSGSGPGDLHRSVRGTPGDLRPRCAGAPGPAERGEHVPLSRSQPRGSSPGESRGIRDHASVPLFSATLLLQRRITWLCS